MDSKRTALFYIVLILRTSTSTPLENTTSSIAPSNITLSSLPTDSSTSSDPIWNSFTIWGTVVGSVIVTTILFCIPCCLGFASSGIRGGSLGAEMMSYSAIANGGGVEAGGCVATCQSVGVLGICSIGFCSAMSLIILGAGTGAALGFGIGFGLEKLYTFISNPIFNSQIVVSNNFTAVDNAGHLNQTLQFSSNGDETAEFLNVSSSTPVENNMSWSIASPWNSTSNHSIWSQYTSWGAVAGAIILTPLSLCIPTCLGFAGAGVKMGSLAANMMSYSAISSGGGVVAGSCVAICQSIGALGVCSLGFVPIGLIISINAAIGFGVGYGVQQLIEYNNELKNGSSEDSKSVTLDNNNNNIEENLDPIWNINENVREESKFDPEAIELHEETSLSKQPSVTGN